VERVETSEQDLPRPARGPARRALLRAAGLGAGVLAAGAAGAAGAVPATAFPPAAGTAAGARPGSREGAGGPRGTGALGGAGGPGTDADAPREAEGPLARARTAADGSPTAPAVPLVDGPDFPIGAFWPPHPFASTLDRYRELADAGFTFFITGDSLFDERSAAYALGLADQVGLKALVAADPRMLALAHYLTVTDDRTVASSITTADATAWVDAALAAYTAHPSFAGFSLYDEPGTGRFPTVAALTSILRTAAPGLLPYANINRGNGDTYRAFVRNYLETVRPSMISFDRYPILTEGLDTAYFETWAIIREAALTAGIPAWTYIQSTGFNDHPIPTAGELAWQINTSLAYGCKGIQYFTYWTPDPARGEGYTQALITTDGNKTPLYTTATTLNTTWLQPVGRQLKPLVSETVQHANDTPLPTGTTPFTPGTHLTHATGDPAIIALHRPPRHDDGTRHLLITNRATNTPATLHLTPNTTTVGAVARFDPVKGAYGAAGSAEPFTVRLDAGGAALYRLTPPA
jgi:hypothetical protein